SASRRVGGEGRIGAPEWVVRERVKTAVAARVF
ncbi:hypothetical protein ABH926_006255, partial [Catenulispora sp. GP43]